MISEGARPENENRGLITERYAPSRIIQKSIL